MTLFEQVLRVEEKKMESIHQEYNNPFDSAASEGKGLMSSRPNVFGAHDVYDNGSRIMSTRQNIFGGYDEM